MNPAENILQIKKSIPKEVKITAVSKTYSTEKILQVYETGQKIFGENKVQELVKKYKILPKDIEWHMIGHLQTNKVKQITPFVDTIQSVDSMKLLLEINKQAKKSNRIIKCLLQIHIAEEETKFGLDLKEAEEILMSQELKKLANIQVTGLMGMATLTDNQHQIELEFKSIKNIFDRLKKTYHSLSTLSIGMSSDYSIAISQGSNLVRIGSLIFGTRGYN